MQAVIRRKLSMAARARDFAAAHPVADPSFDIVLKRLEANVIRANTMGMQQNDGQIGERAAVARRQSLRDAIRRHQLRRLIRIAALATKQYADLRGLFVMPAHDLPNKAFILAARSLLASATQHKDRLLPLGLGDSFVADLTTALDGLDAATEKAHAGRSDHVGARADLTSIARECGRDVEVLDTFYRGQFVAGSDVLFAWDSARNIPGPFKHQAEAGPPAEEAAA